MRLQGYLKEEFVDSVKFRGVVYEIFVNPSRSELKDLKESSPSGYRFVVDTKFKKVYFVGSELTHADVFDAKSDLLPKFDYEDYFSEGKNTDRVFTGSGEWGKKIISDSWDIHGDIQRYADNPETVTRMKTLYEKDMKWVNRYVPEKDIKEIIGKLIERMDKYGITKKS